jgi:hypothetical protein
MGTRTPLVGRERSARAGCGARPRGRRLSLAALPARPGIGKSRLAEEATAASSVQVLHGSATEGATAPYGPIVAAPRSHLRAEPQGLAECGPLRDHLALLLPELGEPAAESDRSTIFEALRCAFAHLACEGPAIVVLDDLQWSDEASLELLAALASPLRQARLPLPGGGRPPRR